MGLSNFVPQPLYREEEHRVWRTLYARMQERWDRYANLRYLEGMSALHLDPDRIPRLEDVNRFLCPRTGFVAKPVGGYVPAYVFFDCLRRREFPTTVTIRPADQLDYLPEPDIFHDVAGHVPMHTDAAFAEALVRFGECAHSAAELAGGIRDRKKRMRRIESILKAMARFFWFTVEFGLMRENDGLKACGSGLLSSYGELGHAIESPDVERVELRLEDVVHQPFEIDHYQPLLMVLESFEQLYDMVGSLERWIRSGRLDEVAPGEPQISMGDLKSFLVAEHVAA